MSSPGILRLRLHNFKSYPGQFDVELSEGAGANPFVSVVGPNGSGKSNLLDAVAFVIGLSSQALRCESLNDLVHSTSDAAVASVEAVLVDRSFKRTTRDEFYIGAERVAREQYLDQWRQLNVIGSLCIAQQGAIERVASQSPADLGRLIEELVADRDLIAEHAQLAERVQNQLVTAKKSQRTKRKAQSELQHYSQVAEARERYESLKADLQAAEDHHKELSQRLQDSRRAELAQICEQLSREFAAARATYENSAANHKSGVRQLTRENRRANTAKQAEQRLAASLADLQAQKPPLQDRAAAIEQELRQLEPQLVAAESDLSSLVAERDAADRKLAALSASVPSATTHKSAHRPAIAESEAEWALSNAKDRDELHTRRREFSAASTRVQIAETVVDDTQSSLRLLETTLAEHASRLAVLETSVADHESVLTHTRTELEDIHAEQADLEAQTSELKTKLRDAASELKRSEGNRRAEQRRARVLDAVAKLRREINGVVDVLPALVDAKSDNDRVALDRVLAVNAESVVVDTQATAFACIERLRSEQLSLTFLPLASLQVRPINSQLRNLPQGASLLLDVVEFAPSVRTAVAYALQDTVVCDDMDQALHLRRSTLPKTAIVVRNGALLSSSGLMSGVSSQSSTRERAAAAIQRRARTLGDKYKTAVDRTRELQALDETASSKVIREQKIIEVQTRQQAQEQERQRSLELEKEHLVAALDEATPKLEAALEAKHAAETALEAVLATLDRSRRAHFKPLAKKLKVSLDAVLAECEDLTASSETTNASTEFARQRSRIAEQREYVEERMALVNNYLAELRARQQSLRNALESVEADLATLQTQISEATARRDELDAARSEIGSAVAEQAEAASAAEEATEAALSAVNECERRLNIAEERLAALEGESRPTSSSSSSSSTSDLSTEHVALQVELDALDERIASLRNELADAIVSRHAEDEHHRAEAALEEASAEAISQRDSTAELNARLTTLANRRSEQLQAVLDDLQTAVNEVYAEISGGGEAKLTPLNDSAIFEDGISFSAMPVGKFYCPIGQLSGGERSMAALAFLLGVQKVRPSPFVVLDEVDAALDARNVGFLASYLRENCAHTQYVVVSLKPRLYQRASHLVGVYKGPQGSAALTLALESS